MLIRSKWSQARSSIFKTLFSCTWTLIGFLLGFTFAPLPAKGQSPAETEPAAQLKVQSNLVEIRVVVRDAQGKPVTGLTRQDFKVFDRGKQQSIAQFEEVGSLAAAPPAANLSSNPVSPASPAPAAPASAARPTRFIAFYFDDLDTSDGDMIQARDAARQYLAANLQPTDSIGIFTTSKMLTRFTTDPRQIQEALSQLHASTRAQTRIHECPDLSDYQAQELLENNDPESNSWKVALAEANACPAKSVFTNTIDPSHPNLSGMQSIRMMAERVVAISQQLSRENLQQFAQVVNYIAQAPGSRTVIMVSPGFLSNSEQLALDRTIDRALRAQVVINSLDPKGLALMMREADASRSTVVLADPHATQARDVLDAHRKFVAADVLNELAQGTGGQFIHDDNDLKKGFEILAGHPPQYVLAFAPQDLKPDGKFHELKVTLEEKHKGYTIQARKGYYALADRAVVASQPAQPESAIPSQPLNVASAAQPNPAPSAAASESAPLRAIAPEDQEKQQIQDALKSKTDSTDLPVGIEASPSEGQGETRLLAATVHLDTRPLPLRKEDGHSLDAIVFAVAVYDQQDNVVEVKERRAKINLVDDQLPDFLQNGVEINTMFELKPGNYRLRAAVIESNEHRIGSLSQAVVVP